ncbi:MAG: calcium/sodium antiporter [Pseudomonadales bacterium]|uniref:Calcium/sodium antiporter n=1 Tax=Alcanivorax profundi TaxID=2338368 RepID=A0A418Y0C1_9GAMM|nr:MULTISPECIES: calcium/sodium antiporter [Alcanivorax]ERP90107.1 sodium:calcium antiporter [Alcanivorax sp. P2S70]MCG8438269.1 calcium/sodium antiporter [Pseudomonadales bacterium]PNE02367.1 Ca2+/Na+antiporter protein [Alcanivorax sp. MD8A]RJG18696.1 calcium/sodium antiporter [Alcanivorax profundi]
MLLAIAAVIGGLILLVWSADKFVEGAAGTAAHAGMPPLLIGMLIVGFGTSAPEMVVSALAALEGNPSLALGNAYGSNISNIALILGVVAVISPIAVNSAILKKELPILAVITLIAGYQLIDGNITRTDAWILIALLAVLMGWSIYAAMSGKGDVLGGEVETDLADHPLPLKKALFWLVVGLILLVASSRLLVWGAVFIAQSLGVSDLIIGLTIVAIGTSLPELASSIAAVKKNEHDIAFGNVLGSNLFNTLGVVGIAGAISPMAVEPGVLQRDWGLMMALTLALFVMGFGLWGRKGQITRSNGVGLLVVYVAYMAYLGTSLLVTAA